MAVKDLILILFVVLIWAFNFIVIAVGLHHFPPIFFSALRFIFAGFPAAFLIGRGNVPWRTIFSIGIVLGIVQFSLLFVGMHVGMPAGLSSLVLQSQVVFTAVLSAIILKERPVAWQWFGIFLGSAGISMIATTIVGQGTFLGFALVIAAGFAWAVANIIMKKNGNIDMFRLIVWMSLVPPLPLLLLSFLFESGQGTALRHVDALGVGAILYMAHASTVLAFGIWGKMLKRYSATVVAPFSLLVPICGMALASLILGERFEPVRLMGAILVILGLTFIVFGRRFMRVLST